MQPNGFLKTLSGKVNVPVKMLDRKLSVKVCLNHILKSKKYQSMKYKEVC